LKISIKRWRTEEAYNQANLAIELDPKNPMLRLQYSAAISCLGDCENALSQEEMITTKDPGNYLANSLIENSAICCKDYDKVMEAAGYILPARGISMDEVEKIYKQQGFEEAYKEVLRQSEELVQNNYFLPVEMAARYLWVNEPEKAVEWFEKGYEIRDQTMPYIGTKMFCLEPLFNNPRFIEILKKMNLPLPKAD
jgi:tetratricopeptide (TPR) repeat protein